uniref:Adhesion G protein-coupled receptor F3 n=1 Tax=Neovison vison TaxID=452646 RepID=A0A8C7AVF9_NEOVI
MVRAALPVLLLAMTLPPVPSPVAQVSQPAPSQAGGESGQPLDQRSGEESVLASVYVQLALSNQTWPLAISRTLTRPLASASSFPRTLTGLSLTTECNVHADGQSYCACLSGYQWNTSVCSHHRPCQTTHNRRPCGCLVFGSTEAGYCQLLPPVPGRLSPNSWVQTPGTTLNLTLVKSRETTNLNWFLRPAGSPTPILLQPGTHVSLASNPGQAVLSIFNVSHRWAGEYLCCFEARGFRWELSQVVEVPLQATDVARLPDQLSISCATCPGFQLTCCIPSTHLAYTASWSPGEGSKASSASAPGSQCFVLAVQRCPAVDTTYTCELQSPGLAPLRVPISVTVIQDGDTTCPGDSSAIAWNVTKAGHVAQAPCPANRTGVVKRTCGPDGIWEPVYSSCTDAELLALHHRARGLLKTTDKILDMDTDSLWAPAQAQKPSVGSALLLAVETLACHLRPRGQPFSFSSRNVRLQTQLLGPAFPADYRASFSTQPPLQARIPRRSLAPLRHNGTNVSVTSLLLQKLDHLLPSNYGQGLGNSLYATPGLVLSISVMAGGQAFNQGEVIMDFGNTASTPHCVFWDHSLFQGKGGWSDEGCQVQMAHASPTTQCICRHLTAFSILMSQNTVPENPTLELLSQVGLGASILALLVCLGVYRLVWRVVVQNKVAYLRHMALLNMVLCLLAADTCFLGAPLLPPGPQSPLCLAAAFLCHFLYLATFFWMLAQALMLAHQLLFVFRQLSKCRVLSLMVVLGYMCPIGFAGAALGLYLPRGQYLGEGACWLNGKGGALYTFVGPVLAIVGVNGLVLTMAVLKLLRPSLSEGPPVEQRHALLGVTKALLILTPVFGLTWGLGLATLLEKVSIVPHYIFTILNTTQGVFILLFGCLMDKKIREALLQRFSRTPPPKSTISLATYETYIPEHSKGRSEDAR